MSASQISAYLSDSYVTALGGAIALMVRLAVIGRRKVLRSGLRVQI